MRSLRLTNCSAVIAPDVNAFRPYWTPTLSNTFRTNPVAGSRPSWLTTCSAAAHLTPVGFVTGAQRAATGMAAGQLPVAVVRLAKVISHDVQTCGVPKPITATF